MANRFEDERAFVSSLQDTASKFYQDFFGAHERFAIEEAGDGELEKQLDYSGTDQIVKPEGEAKTIHAAQRFRRMRKRGSTDFSIRCRSNGYDTEYQKLILNHADGMGHTPGVYAFGIVDAADDFAEFFFLLVDRLCEALKQGALSKERHKNYVDGKPDGTEAYYITTKALRRVGAVLAHYEEADRRL